MKTFVTVALLGFLVLNITPARAETSATEQVAASVILGGAGCWLGGGIGAGAGAIAASGVKNPATAERAVMTGAVAGCVALGGYALAAVNAEAAEAPEAQDLNQGE
ncbi:MAG: hypothetical protein ACXWQO_06555 [Bdellovibrionota bacterium]